MVIDVEKYSEFLPWCKNAKIINHFSQDNFQAELLINFKNFYEKYTDKSSGPPPLTYIDKRKILETFVENDEALGQLLDFISTKSGSAPSPGQ